PPAKVYDRGCALGPLIVPADALDPYALDIRCAIGRRGRPLYEGTTNTGALHRRLDTLVVYLSRHNQFPTGVYLMTGTGIVPPDDVVLCSGDETVITIA